MEDLQVLLNGLVLLAIISIGLSVMLSPITGKKVDPWLILRPIAKVTSKLFMRGLRGTVKLLSNWSGATFRRANRAGTPTWARFLLYPLSFFLGLGWLVLSIPVEIVGSAPKIK